MRTTFVTEDVLTVLIQLEAMGFNNYTALSTLTTDATLQILFTRLAEQDYNHKCLFEKIRQNTNETVQLDEDYSIYANALLNSHIQFLNTPQPKTFDEGYQIALQIEKDAIFFLNELKPILGNRNNRTLDVIIAEERRHLVSLMQYHL